MRLTPQVAEKIAREKFANVKDDEDREWHVLHSKAVGETALILAGNKNVDRETLLVAGWLHDIGRIEQDEEHGKRSVDILEREGYELSEELKDCILEHGNKGNPGTEEGKIIKAADKISCLRPELVSLLVRYNKGKIKTDDVNFLRKMAEGAIKNLEEFNLE